MPAGVHSIMRGESAVSHVSTDRDERAGRPGWVRRTLHRLVASDEELDAEELQNEADSVGAEAVCDCRRGDQVQLAGRLTSVVYNPRETAPTLEAELWDGSGTVLLVWLGRRRIAGIEPGRSLLARGRLATRDNRLVIYNPWYELQAHSA